MKTYPRAFSFVQDFWHRGGKSRANPWVWVLLLLVDIVYLPVFCWRWATEYHELKAWRMEIKQMEAEIRRMRHEV